MDVARIFLTKYRDLRGPNCFIRGDAISVLLLRQVAAEYIDRNGVMTDYGDMNLIWLTRRNVMAESRWVVSHPSAG